MDTQKFLILKDWAERTMINTDKMMEQPEAKKINTEKNEGTCNLKIKFTEAHTVEEKRKETSDLQQRELDDEEAQMRKRIEQIMKEKDEMEKRLQAEKDSLMLQIEEERRNNETEKEKFGLQLREIQARGAKMREEIEDLVQKRDEIERKFQDNVPGLVFQLEKQTRNIEKEKKKSEIQLRKIEAKEAQMLKMKEDLVNERDEIERRLKADIESLALQLENKTRNMEQEKEEYELQLKTSEAREPQIRKEMHDLEKEKEELKKRLQAERHRLVLNLEEETKIMQNEKKRSDFQQKEFKAKERQMREEIETLEMERNEMRRKFIADKNRLVLQLKENTRYTETEKEGSELQQQFEAIKAQMREDVRKVLKERDEMWRAFQASTDRLVLQLEQKSRELEEEKERSELQWQETKAREAQIRDEMEDLVKQRDQIKRFQADKDNLLLLLENEKERSNKMERSQQLVRRIWIEHCDIFGENILKKEKMLEEMTIEVEALNRTVKNLKQKARDMNPEMKLNEVGKRANKFVPPRLQNLWKKKNIKIKQDLEKEIERLEKIENLHKENEAMELELKTERESMEKEKNQERIKFKKSDSETIDEVILEEIKEQRSEFVVEKEMLVHKFLEKDKILKIAEGEQDAEMTAEIEKEEHQEGNMKLKYLPLLLLQKLCMKTNFKRKRQIEQGTPELQDREIEDREAQMSDEVPLEESLQPHKEAMVLESEKERENMENKWHQIEVEVEI